MGETIDDRLDMILASAKLDPVPDSVPINVLVPVKGTLEHAKPVHPFELVRLCALARIVMPKCRVRLSAGRISLSDEAQAMFFMWVQIPSSLVKSYLLHLITTIIVIMLY